MPKYLTLIAASLSIAVSGCNNPPAPKAASHPAADLLTCPAEPAALTDEEVIADRSGILDDIYDVDVLLSGRACRDAVQRLCAWHQQRGYEGSCALLPPISYPRPATD